MERNLALRVATFYGRTGLAAVMDTTRALSRAFDGGRTPVPPLHELLEPPSWPDWLRRYDRDSDPAPHPWTTLADCDGVTTTPDCDTCLGGGTP